MTITKRPTQDEFAKGVKEYIDKLKSMNPEDAKRLSIDALKRSGVLDEQGNTKETIVTGDFFGW